MSHDLDPPKGSQGPGKSPALSGKSSLVKYFNLASKISFWFSKIFNCRYHQISTQRREEYVDYLIQCRCHPQWGNNNRSQGSQGFHSRHPSSPKSGHAAQLPLSVTCAHCAGKGWDVTWWWHTWRLQKMKDMLRNWIQSYPYPETNSREKPLKIGRIHAPKGKFIFQPLIFRGELLVSGRVNLQKR